MSRSLHRRRVLIIVENLPVPFDRRVWQEATALEEAGYRVSIICPTGKGYEARRERIDGIAVFRHPLPIEARGAFADPIEYLSAAFWQFLLAWRVLLTQGFDVIHACNPPDTIFLIGGFFKLLLRKKFVFDHHDLCPELYEAKFGKRDWLYRFLLRLERWTFAAADISIATNESYRQIAMGRGGMRPDRVFVVRSGPLLDRMRVKPPNEALKHGRRYLVGYVGVMGKQEGISYLLAAAQYIVRELERTDIHFTLVGSGPELASLQVEARALGIADFVTFTGRIPDAELLDVLNTADLCVNPDEVNDMNDKSTMNKILEYMSLGRAIVQFDMIEGRVSAGDSSLYAEPNDARDLARKIVELLNDPARRAEMGARGQRRVVEELAWHHQVPELLAAYAALWPGSRPAVDLTVGEAGHGA